MRRDIAVINPNSNIAIATLWTKKEKILEALTEDLRRKIAIIGTVYTSYGVNYMLESLGKYNKVDTLIIYGADLSGSGDAIIRTFSRDFEGLKLLFDLREIEGIVRTVKVLDLREDFRKGNLEALKNAIIGAYKPEAREVRERVILKVEEIPEVKSWPLPLSGHYIFETSLFRAWIKVLDLIMRFGTLKFSEYEEMQKEYMNVMVTLGLYGKTYTLEDGFFRYLSKEEFERHVSQTLSKEKPEEVSYTYGERLLAHLEGGDQISRLIARLSRKPYSRRAVAITWIHKVDAENEEPPCLIMVQGEISGDYYNHTAVLRSNDMFRAWPLNMYAQIKLSELIVNGINERTGADFKLGTVTTVSVSAHVYEHNFGEIEALLSRHSSRLYEFVQDPKGNFIVYHRKNKVVLEHRTPENELVDRIETGEFWEVYNHLKNGSLYSMHAHALYVGKEIAKAFECLKRGEEYVQDAS